MTLMDLAIANDVMTAGGSRSTKPRRSGSGPRRRRKRRKQSGRALWVSASFGTPGPGPALSLRKCRPLCPTVMHGAISIPYSCRRGGRAFAASMVEVSGPLTQILLGRACISGPNQHTPGITTRAPASGLYSEGNTSEVHTSCQPLGSVVHSVACRLSIIPWNIGFEC